MEVKVESKIGVLHSDCSRIYTFLSDCNNFQHFANNEKIKDLRTDTDSCSFEVEGIGAISCRIVERKQDDLVKFQIENVQAENIFLWIQLKSASAGITRVKLTTKLEAGMMLGMIIKKPLKNGMDRIVEALEKICK